MSRWAVSKSNWGQMKKHNRILPTAFRYYLMWTLCWCALVSACVSGKNTPRNVTSTSPSQIQDAYPVMALTEAQPAYPYPVAHTSTPHPTPTSLPQEYPEYAGLIYWNHAGQWQIQADGQVQLILDRPFAQFSSSGTQALYEQDWDIWIADLSTGERRNLTNTPDRSECCPNFWPARPEVILFRSGSFTSDNLFSAAFLTSIRTNGEGYSVLDDQHPFNGDISPSPDGQLIAYGAGWLYRWDTQTVERFQTEGYSGIDLQDIVLISPAWSPDGLRLAWTVSADFDGQRLYGAAIFNLLAQTAIAFHFFEPVGFDGPIPNPLWSPDGQWLAIDSFAEKPDMAGIWIMSASGQPGDEFQLQPNIGGHANKDMIWSPGGRWLATSPSPTSGDVIWIYESGQWQMKEIRLDNPGRVFAWLKIE